MLVLVSRCPLSSRFCQVPEMSVFDSGPHPRFGTVLLRRESRTFKLSSGAEGRKSAMLVFDPSLESGLIL